MLIQKTLSVIFIIASTFIGLFAQQKTPATVKQQEISPELRRNAVDFLRQTIDEIPNLKAVENQTFFTIETAGLLWKYDEKEARKLIGRSVTALKQEISQTVNQYQKVADEIRKKRAKDAIDYGSNGNSVYANVPAGINANAAKALLERDWVGIYETGMQSKFRRVAQGRRNLLATLTYVDPFAAYEFLSESKAMLPEGVGEFDYAYSDKRREFQIIVELLNRNEVEKSIEIARRNLEDGLDEQYVETLLLIYEKDAAKGNTLAEETVTKLKGINVNGINSSHMARFFESALATNSYKQPLLNEKSIREAARILGKSVLAELDEEHYFTPTVYARKIQPYAPREALQIMRKAKRKPRRTVYAANSAANIPAMAANKAAEAVKLAANTPSRRSTKSPKPISTPTPIPEEFEMDPKADLIQKLIEGNFTPEQRKVIVAKAKEFALANNPYGFVKPDAFISVLAELARFSIYSTDKEISDALMAEAEVYSRPETKNALDYAAKLMLAGGYSKHHPEKSFLLMESMTPINEIIESAAKVGSFVDFESEIFSNGEISAAVFLGESPFSRRVTRNEELSLFIRNLAKADFKRTVGLAEKFEKKEVKMAAKFLILQSLLGETRRQPEIGYDY